LFPKYRGRGRGAPEWYGPGTSLTELTWSISDTATDGMKTYDVFMAWKASSLLDEMLRFAFDQRDEER
jgi:hypothetical protein